MPALWITWKIVLTPKKSHGWIGWQVFGSTGYVAGFRPDWGAGLRFMIKAGSLSMPPG